MRYIVLAPLERLREGTGEGVAGSAGRARLGRYHRQDQGARKEEEVHRPTLTQKGGEVGPPKGASDQREIPRREGTTDRER
jgi:hypothetical protein